MNGVLSTLKSFAKCSGLKINYEKSIAYQIGSLAGHNNGLLHEYNLSENIQWSSEPIKTLGVIIPITQREKIYEYNYKPKLKNIETVLNQWAKRKLSIQGKMCIIKTLAMSQLVYLCSVLPTPPKKLDYEKQIEKLIFKFLWNEKPDKIKRKVLYNTKENGGLGMPNFKLINIAAKISWLRRYLDSQEDKIWKVLVDMNLQKYSGPFLLYCNISPDDKIIDAITSTVVKDWVLCWSKYNFNKSPLENEIAIQIVWHNSLLNTKQNVHYNELIQNNILYVGQFHNPTEHRLFHYHEFKDKYNINITFIDYYRIISKIPRRWLDQIEQYEQIDVQEGLWSANIDELRVRNNIHSYIYLKLLKGTTETPEKSQLWWADELETPRAEIEWASLYKDIYTISNNCKLREFHFKWLHNIVVVNNKLCQWNLVESALCDFCDMARDSIKHRFWLCTHVQEIWGKLWQHVTNELHIDWNMNYKTITLNTGDGYDQMMKCIVLCAKFFIYRCFIAKTKPNFESLLVYINRIELVERRVALKNGKEPKHIKKWQKWLNQEAPV